jgi:hypothetical protein
MRKCTYMYVPFDKMKQVDCIFFIVAITRNSSTAGKIQIALNCKKDKCTVLYLKITWRSRYIKNALR